MSNNPSQDVLNKVRYHLVSLSHYNKVPHLACSLSCVEILYTLFFDVMKLNPLRPDWRQRDRLLLGKGHAAAALYTMLSARGFFCPEDVNSLGTLNSMFEEHPGLKSPPGVENISGSLGHALGLATGMAKAAKISDLDNHFYVVAGDGELNEGSNWEAAMFAPAHSLDNLTLIVDFNKLQGTGKSCEIMHLEDLVEKFSAFGWNAMRVDGHNTVALKSVLEKGAIKPGKPTAIIADTVKGKGITFMEDDNNWHYRIPNLEELSDVAIGLGISTQARDTLSGGRDI